MASGDMEAENKTLDELRIVDANAQVQEQVDDLLSYMPEDSAVREMVETSKLGVNPFVGAYSGHPDYDYKRANGGDSPVLTDREIGETIPPEDVSSLLPELKIDTGIVHPTMLIGLAEANNRVFASEAARAYNDWLLDRLGSEENLVGNVVVAPHRPERAADEIERVADEDSIVGVTLPSVGTEKPLGHERYDPIYDVAERKGFPVSIYATVGIKPFRNQVEGSEYYGELLSYQPGMSSMRDLISLMFEGAPERFPDIEFVMHGAGIGWIPYIMYRIDDHYLQSPPELPALNQLPSKHIKESFHFGTHPIGSNHDIDHLVKLIRMVGPERLLFTSDVPHPITDTPQNIFDMVSDHFSSEEVAQIFGKNAVDLYGL